MRVCCLDNWREVLAALVTYAGPDEFSSLCGELHQFFIGWCNEEDERASLLYIPCNDIDVEY